MFYQEEKFINQFVQLIKECHEIILEIYNTDFEVIEKEDKSPLTLADQKCNQHICQFLKKFDDSILIISEENKNLDYEKRKEYDWCWLVDPIDGTKEFVKKNGNFTVNIGLCYKSVPVFGIVSIPVSGDIYYGIKGIGSFKLVNNNKSKLNIKMKDFEQEKLRIVASSSHINEKTQNFINNFNNPEIVSVGSSIKLLYIADDKADVYPRLGLTSEWDTCAAHAVVKYAGGRVFNLEEKELQYNKKNILNPYFIVY
tara:strand:- start:759 stop:1523 length:765 start_codon:yes stop_codon:yes gene_type:complete